MDLQSTYFIERFSARRSSLSLLQITRGNVGRTAEFPKERGDQNQVLESAEEGIMEKKKVEKMCIFDLQECEVLSLEGE